MRAVIVDDEAIMLRSFRRNSRDIEDLVIIGEFEDAEEAITFIRSNPCEIVFLDVEMPGMNGLECARALRMIRPDILIVFISAYEKYLRDSNELGVDYYIIKPYKKETLMQMMERMRLLHKRLEKSLYIQMFGRFTVLKDGEVVNLTGKAKEILALCATRRGKEISNEEIYSTIWENREYSNANMKVYYNALKRLKDSLKEQGLENLLLSSPHGQMVNTALFDCDYYDWQDKSRDSRCRFEGEFLSEYSWGEYLLGAIMEQWYGQTAD